MAEPAVNRDSDVNHHPDLHRHGLVNWENVKKTWGSTTCRIFVNRLAAALNMAVREGLIDSNPFKLLDAKEKPQKKSAMREFLTIEELRTLIATPCRYDIVKKAFLFSCFTGLRYSDMMALKWNEIHKAADGKTLYIEHEQVNTKNRSLYLEYYETGFRKKENLHLYLIPDDAPQAKKLNGETFRKAQEIRAQRILNPPTFEKKKKTEDNKTAKTKTWLG